MVLFDLDNTLVDRARFFRRWAEQFAGIRGLATEAIDTIVDADGDGMVDRTSFFVSLRGSLALNDSVNDMLESYWTDYLGCFEPDPKVNEALSKLRDAGFKLGIVTNGHATWQKEKIRRAGLLSLVDACVVSGEVGWRKPDGRIFEEAARRCGCQLTGWMVGDSASADIIGAIDVGLQAIWMSRGRSWTETECEPACTVETIDDAVARILA